MSEKPLGLSAVYWQMASVQRITQQTAKIKSFFLDLTVPMTFIAGQHIDVRLTAADGYQAVRSYSIASAPESRERIEIAIELLENGEVSPFFHDTVRPGDNIEVRGPLGGHFIWGPSCGGPLLMLGGGSGLVPLLSILRHRKSKRSTVPATLLLSAQTWDDIPFREELLEMDRDHDGFQLVLTLTRDAPRRTQDFQRRVDTAMMAEVLQRMPSAPSLIYACGTNKFVDAAVDAAINAGLPKAAEIRTERYGG